MSEQQGPRIHWIRNIAMLIILVFGVTLIMLAPKMKSPPNQGPVKERAVKVRAMKVPALNVVPRTTGFGRVSPGRNWDSVAEVAGRVIWISDELRDGKIVTKGTELLRIEDANYRLALVQADAQLKVSEVRQKSATDALTIAKQNLSLLQAEYKRQQKLAGTGVVSKSVLENSQRQALTGQTQVQELQNTLALITAEYQVLLAQQDAAKLDLQRTLQNAPFDVRITEVNIGTAQYANKGQLLFTADGLDIAEIEARFSIGILRPLIKGVAPGNDINIRTGATRLKAVVRLRTTHHTVEWPARVDRVSGTIDPLSQTLGVIVAVDQPYASASPGVRPPLRRDTFVEVELRSEPIKNQAVVPWGAVHDGALYVINDESRLEKRQVTVEFRQQGYAVIKTGVAPGERIVSSDLLTAVEGMLLSPQEDKKSKRKMVIAATGKDPKK